MSGYRQQIVAATGCAPEDAGPVEEIMRTSYGTLDHLTAGAFNSEARMSLAAWRELAATDPETADWYRRGA